MPELSELQRCAQDRSTPVGRERRLARAGTARRAARGVAALALVALIGLASSVPAGAQDLNEGGDNGATITSLTLTSDPGADDRTYAIGDVVAASVTFSEAVTVDEAIGSPTLALEIGDSPEQAAYAGGSGTASLVFRYTVEEDDEDTDGIAVGANALALNDARITAGGTDAALAHAAVPANSSHKVDGVRPSLERIEVTNSGDMVILEYDEQLGDPAPSRSQFTVKVGVVEAALDEDIDPIRFHQSIILFLADKVLRGKTVTVSYMDPTGGDDEAAIQDRAGNDAASFTDHAVENESTYIDATLPVVTIEAITETVSYNVGTGTPWDIAKFRLIRTGNTDQRLRVKLGWEELATMLGDPEAATVFVEFSPGQTEKTVWHLVIDTDGDNNPLTSITFQLIAHDGYNLGQQYTAQIDVTVPGQQQARSESDRPTLAVADARAKEGTDSTVDFAVTLDRPARGTVTVDYATSNGTAKAGADYTATAGTLTFAPGDTEMTVSVPVLDDEVDEDKETFTLVLRNASGASLGDREATGTIENADPIPQAWLSRFGRTAAGHVVDAVGGRLAETAARDSQVTLAGERLALGPGTDAARPWDDVASGSRGLSGRELLRGSSFLLSLGADGQAGDGAGTRWTAWGRADSSRFDGTADRLALDGDVTTLTLGTDAAWNRWLTGAAIGLSEGEGGFRRLEGASGQNGRGAGVVESRLTSIHPYLRYQASDRLSLWGMLGYGSGDLTLEADGSGRWSTDTAMQMAAAGTRSVLVSAAEAGDLELAVRADAMLVRMRSDAATGEAGNLAATDSDASRLRVVLEGAQSVALGDGRTLTPSLEAGIRHDSGDAETGTGIEIGGGLRLADPDLGLTVDAKARGLVAHEDGDYAEWGASGSVRVDPGASGQGLSLALTPAWGADSGGSERLWSIESARSLSAGEQGKPDVRFDAEAGYGFAAFGGRGTVTPYAGLSLSESGEHIVRSGVRWVAGPALSFGLEGTRRSPANEAAVDHGVWLSTSLHW